MTCVDFGTTSWARQEGMLSELSAACVQTQPLTQYSLPDSAAGQPPLPNNPLPILDQTWGLQCEGGDEKDGRRCVCREGKGGKAHPA